MDVAYIVTWHRWGEEYSLLNPTGKWKLRTGPKHTNSMYVEHKKWIFKFWIEETHIAFLPEEETHIFKCSQ